MAAQCLHQRFGRTRFADRYGVYPNRALHGIGIRLPETLVPMLEIGWGFEGAAAQVAADQEGGEVPQRGVKAAYHAYGSCVGIGLFYRKLKRKI